MGWVHTQLLHHTMICAISVRRATLLNFEKSPTAAKFKFKFQVYLMHWERNSTHWHKKKDKSIDLAFSFVTQSW